MNQQYNQLTEEIRYSAEQLREYLFNVLKKWEMSEDNSRITAQLMIQTDLLGVESHGISTLPYYERLLREHGLNIKAEPTCIHRFGAVSLWDAQAGLGHPAAYYAMNDAIEQAKQYGIAFAGVRNSHHFGAAGVYARMASEAGLVGIVTSSASGLLQVPTRASIPVLGTNPIAISAPATGQSDVVLDIATTTSAFNKVRVKSLRNQEIPSGWVIDKQGNTVQDSNLALTQIAEGNAGLTPLGSSADLASHKGYGLALFAQILGATLNGAGFPAMLGSNHIAADIGHSFIVINPSALGGESFADEVAAISDFLHQVKPLNPDFPVLVPGDLESLQRQQRQENGIPLPFILLDQLRLLSERAGCDFLPNT